MKKISFGAFPLSNIDKKSIECFNNFLIKTFADKMSINDTFRTLGSTKDFFYLTPDIIITQFLSNNSQHEISKGIMQRGVIGSVKINESYLPKFPTMSGTNGVVSLIEEASKSGGKKFSGSDDSKKTSKYKDQIRDPYQEIVQRAFNVMTEFYKSLKRTGYYNDYVYYPIYSEKLINFDKQYMAGFDNYNKNQYEYQFFVLSDDLAKGIKLNEIDYNDVAIVNMLYLFTEVFPEKRLIDFNENDLDVILKLYKYFEETELSPVNFFTQLYKILYYIQTSDKTIKAVQDEDIDIDELRKLGSRSKFPDPNGKLSRQLEAAGQNLGIVNDNHHFDFGATMSMIMGTGASQSHNLQSFFRSLRGQPTKTQLTRIFGAITSGIVSGISNISITAARTLINKNKNLPPRRMVEVIEKLLNNKEIASLIKNSGELTKKDRYQAVYEMKNYKHIIVLFKALAQYNSIKRQDIITDMEVGIDFTIETNNIKKNYNELIVKNKLDNSFGSFINEFKGYIGNLNDNLSKVLGKMRGSVGAGDVKSNINQVMANDNANNIQLELRNARRELADVESQISQLSSGTSSLLTTPDQRIDTLKKISELQSRKDELNMIISNKEQQLRTYDFIASGVSDSRKEDRLKSRLNDIVLEIRDLEERLRNISNDYTTHMETSHAPGLDERVRARAQYQAEELKIQMDSINNRINELLKQRDDLSSLGGNVSDKYMNYGKGGRNGFINQSGTATGIDRSDHTFAGNSVLNGTNHNFDSSIKNTSNESKYAFDLQEVKNELAELYQTLKYLLLDDNVLGKFLDYDPNDICKFFDPSVDLNNISSIDPSKGIVEDHLKDIRSISAVISEALVEKLKDYFESKLAVMSDLQDHEFGDNNSFFSKLKDKSYNDSRIEKLYWYAAKQGINFDKIQAEIEIKMTRLLCLKILKPFSTTFKRQLLRDDIHMKDETKRLHPLIAKMIKEPENFKSFIIKTDIIKALYELKYKTEMQKYLIGSRDKSLTGFQRPPIKFKNVKNQIEYVLLDVLGLKNNPVWLIGKADNATIDPAKKFLNPDRANNKTLYMLLPDVLSLTNSQVITQVPFSEVQDSCRITAKDFWKDVGMGKTLNVADIAKDRKKLNEIGNNIKALRKEIENLEKATKNIKGKDRKSNDKVKDLESKRKKLEQLDKEYLQLEFKINSNRAAAGEKMLLRSTGQNTLGSNISTTSSNKTQDRSYKPQNTRS